MAVYGKNIVQRVVCFLQAHPRTVLYPTAILTLVATVSAVDLTYNFSPEELFRGNDDLTEYRADFQKTFKLQKRVILLVLETKGREDLLTPINLTWMAKISKELLGVEGVEKVLAPTSLKEPKRNIVPFIPVMALPIIDEIPVTHEDALVLRGVIEKSGPLGQQWLSPNLKMGLVAIKIENGIQAIEAILTIVEAIESALHKHSPPQGLSWELSGLAAIRADVIRNLKNDQLTLVPLVTIIFILILIVIFRSIVGVILPLVAVGVGLAWTIAGFVILGQAITVISNALPLLLMIIGVSNGVHIIHRYGEEFSSCRDQTQASIETMKHMVVACGLTILTTALGFGSLAGGSSYLQKSTAAQSIFGLVIVYITIVIVFCTLLHRFVPPPQSLSLRSSRTFSALGRVIMRYRWGFAFLSIAIIGTGLVYGQRVVINSHYLETYEETHPISQTLHRINENLGGFLQLEIGIHGPPGFLLEGRNLRKIAALQAKAQNEAEVISSLSYVDIHRQYFNGIKTKDDKFWVRTNEEIQSTQKFLEFMHEVFYPQYFINQDHSRGRVLLRVKDIGTKAGIELINKIEAHIEEIFPTNGKISGHQTGEVYVNAKAVDRFIHELLYSFVGASILIFFIIGLLFRSLRFGLVAIVPNLTPLIMTMGYMGICGYDLSAGNVVVFCLSLGIAVDNTIHFLARFREDIEKYPVDKALESTLQHTGRAILVSTIIILSGLFVLMQSNFVPTQRFAELTGFTMLSAIFGDLILLPTLLAFSWSKELTKVSISPN